MRKYDVLRKEIEKLKADTVGKALPYLAYLDSIDGGYELSISFWDGKDNSGKEMPPTLFYKFAEQDEAEQFLLKYLKNNKAFKPFVLFSNEEDIEP